MKKLLVLLFSILISFNSYGEWTFITKTIEGPKKGDTYYLDLDTIKENGGYVYYWHMNNFKKPDQWGDMSSKGYSQGDCGTGKYRLLSGIFYQQPMGRGGNDSYTPENPEWSYPFPNTISGIILDYVCDYVN
jgi:hypothetical protein